MAGKITKARRLLGQAAPDSPAARPAPPRPPLMAVGGGPLLAVSLAELAGLQDAARKALAALEASRPGPWKAAARTRLARLQERAVACASLTPVEGQRGVVGEGLRVKVPSGKVRDVLVDCQAVRHALRAMRMRVESRAAIARALKDAEGIAARILQPDMDLFRRPA